MTKVPIGKLLASSVSLLTVSSTFDLLFKVLFTFPSLYFFAIGLPDIFSFRWDLPPNLGCNPKQPDSSKGWHLLEQHLGRKKIRDCHPLWCIIPNNLYPKVSVAPVTTDRKTTILKVQFTLRWRRTLRILNLSNVRFTRRYWGHPC